MSRSTGVGPGLSPARSLRDRTFRRRAVGGRAERCVARPARLGVARRTRAPDLGQPLVPVTLALCAESKSTTSSYPAFSTNRGVERSVVRPSFADAQWLPAPGREHRKRGRRIQVAEHRQFNRERRRTQEVEQLVAAERVDPAVDQSAEFVGGRQIQCVWSERVDERLDAAE